MLKKPKKILIVDDESGMLRLLEKRLQVDGYRVISALSGAAAIKIAKIDFPDLILTDIMIPDMSGQEIAKVLKQDPETQDIPVIFITATLGVEKDKGNERIDIEGQLYRIFAKPIHTRKLLSVIRKTINKREHNQ